MGQGSSLMGLADFAGGASSLASGFSQSQAFSAQGAYQQQVGNINAQFAELQAEDARKRGYIAEGKQRSATKRLVGAQRAALAAQGIDVGTGSAADIQEETAIQGELDALTIRNNAWQESWGYRAQAADYRSQAKFQAIAARAQSKSTLLTGGLNAVSGFAKGASNFPGSGPISSGGGGAGTQFSGAPKFGAKLMKS